MKLRICAILFLIFTFHVEWTFSQVKRQFNHLTMENGLSQNSVMAITQDQQGMMWFGTRGGLNRYDGFRFKVYTHSGKSNGISDNSITSLVSDRGGSLVVGTENGLDFYDSAVDQFTSVNRKNSANTLSNDSIECLHLDRNKQLWIGTLNGLNLLLDRKLKKFKTFFFGKPGASNQINNILSIQDDLKGNLWIGTGAGLVKMNIKGERFSYQIIKHDSKNTSSISSNYVRSLAIDKNGKLWIGTDNGLNFFDEERKVFIRFQKREAGINSLINNDIRKLMFDNKQQLWICTQEGVSIYHTEEKIFENYKHNPDHKNSLSQNSTHSIYQNSGGTIFVGTYYKGVNAVYPYKTDFTTYINSKSPESISSNIVSALAEDKTGNLWIGTEGGGLNYFNKRTQKFDHYFAKPNDSNALNSNLIKTLCLTKEGQLVVGTHRGGLLVFNEAKQNFKRIINVKSQKGDVGMAEVIALAKSSDGQIWVGSKNGLSTFSKSGDYYPKKTTKSPIESKLSNRFIQVLFEDKSQNMWIGTMAGLFRYNLPSKKLTAFYKSTDSLSLASDRINCIIQSHDGKIVVGTYLGGLSFFDPKTEKFKTYSQKQGLPNQNILGIIEDKQHQLWLSTDNGISRMDVRKEKFTNYTKSDGLAGNDFNIRSFLMDREGRLYFGGYDGLSAFYANQIEMNRQPAKIIISGLKLFNEPVSVNDHNKILTSAIGNAEKIAFNYKQNNFTIEFVLLNYIKPEKNRYAYRLEGYSKNWTKTSLPFASFNNLPSGTYTFLVRGVNNDGIPGKNVAKLKILVHPPFWLAWWAYLIYICLIAGVLFILFRYLLVQERLKQSEEIQRMKLNFFTYIAHEIRTPLTLIIGPLERLLLQAKHLPEIQQQVIPVKHNADRLIRLITELLDFRKAESNHLKLHVTEEKIGDFIKEIFLSFSHIAEEKQIDYQFNLNNSDLKVYIDKLQFEKVIFNLLSNAFKYVKMNGRVSLTIIELEEKVLIQVIDDGKGIPLSSQPKLFSEYFRVDDQDPHVIGSGIGLVLSKMIVEAHGGKIDVESKPATEFENGLTNFTIQLRKGNLHFNSSELSEQTNSESDRIEPKGKVATSMQENHADKPSLMAEMLNEEHLEGNILIIEDNDEIAGLIAKIFERYHTFRASDGLAGWERAIEALPDLIICDVMMPKLDGLTLCRRLKSDERTSHIPIIILTARSSHIHHLNGLETGADSYVTKPFSPSILIQNAKNLLHNRMLLRQRFSKLAHLEPESLHLNSVDQAFIMKVTNYIENNLVDENFGVAELAAAIGMSKPVLYKKIRMLTDLSVNDFIKSIRLKKARALFLQQDFTIYEVAYQVGFNDPKYFSREFKKQFGESPKQIKNLNKKE